MGLMIFCDFLLKKNCTNKDDWKSDDISGLLAKSSHVCSSFREIQISSYCLFNGKCDLSKKWYNFSRLKVLKKT